MPRVSLSPAVALLVAFVIPAATVALSAGAGIALQPAQPRMIELHGRIAEQGGWSPTNLTVQAGEKVRFQLTSDDVTHGFAIGRMNMRPVRVMAGATSQVDVTFDTPGKYTFYCTEWCSMAHWRMRGVIEVLGANQQAESQITAPDYVRLGIDIDAPHPASVVPAQRPSARRGAQWQAAVPAQMRSHEYTLSHSPSQAWQALRALPAFATNADDQAVWDAVAWLWLQNASPQTSSLGASLYASNCARCHGAAGKGDGPMAGAQPSGHTTMPTDFTDAKNMLGANTALLEGKVIRGGMGTGMPYWGPIFTDEKRRAVIDYLWQFQFDK
jgi:mono/diheme cytochrome c family protein/plastocyanin